MNPRRPSSIPWLVLALAVGLAVGWFDRGATEVQGTVLLLMLGAFAIALPGHGSAPLLGLLVSLGVPLMAFLLGSQPFNAGSIVAIIPGLLGAGAGRLTGRLLNVAGESFESVPADVQSPWYARVLSTRMLLSLALSALAVVGVFRVLTNLQGIGHPLALFVTLIWQAVSFVGWILLTPAIVRFGAWTGGAGAAGHRQAGINWWQSSMHVAFVFTASLLHAAALALLIQLLFIPVGPSGLGGLMSAAWRSYLLLDLLAYGVILGLAYASDTARHKRDIAMRETALRAELTGARLEALRAQLNPHFLFNALNSIGALSQAGRKEETAMVLDGLSGMLRYVLDEKRALVPLRDELHFVRQYLDIQQLRFGSRLVARIDCPPQLDDVLVPPLVLQPLVENAVEHGIAKIGSGGGVTVRAQSEGARSCSSWKTMVPDQMVGARRAAESGSVTLANGWQDFSARRRR